MATTGEIVLEVHQIGEVRTGGWCDECLLSSVISARFALVSTSTLRVFARWVQHLCDSCGRSFRSPA